MTSLFLSPGDDPFAHLRKHMAVVPEAGFEGVWATIELQPDAFSRQKYTVGVAVATLDGKFSFRLLSDLIKFECLFGREDMAEFRSLVEAAERDLLRAQRDQIDLREVQFETQAIVLGDFWTTAGSSSDAVLGRLFVDVVPFLPRDERKARDFITLDNATVRRMVDEELKRIAGLGFERVRVEPQRAFADRSTGESHWLEFNLEPEGKAGSVISAVYKTPASIELNFLRASRDLATYARLRQLRDQQLGLFVMAPTRDSMPPVEFDRIENLLGEQSWSLEQQGFVVSTHDTPAPLARDVWEWAGIAD